MAQDVLPEWAQVKTKMGMERGTKFWPKKFGRLFKFKIGRLFQFKIGRLFKSSNLNK